MIFVVHQVTQAALAPTMLLSVGGPLYGCVPRHVVQKNDAVVQ